MESDLQTAPRKKKTRWALVIITLFIVGLVIDHFFLHLVFQKKIKEQQQENRSIEKENTQSSATLPHVIGETAPKREMATPTQELVRQFQENVKACLGDHELSQSPNPESLIRHYLEKNPPQSSQFQLENTHVRLPDGSTRRVHLIHSDGGNSKYGTELRYFQLDEEGLPVRIPLKPEETFNPKPEFLDSLKKQGHVIFHQVKENKLLKDGTNISLNTVNNKVFEFQIFGKEKTLSCRELDCLCR